MCLPHFRIKDPVEDRKQELRRIFGATSELDLDLCRLAVSLFVAAIRAHNRPTTISRRN